MLVILIYMDSDLLQTSSPEIKCSICLDNDIEDNVLCSTECSHQFCKKCLDEWLDQGKTSCPICRAEINYFKYQEENNRIVRVTSNRIIETNQQSNLQLINTLRIKIKSYKLLAYFFLLFNVYASYYLIDEKNYIDFFRDNYNDCMENLTERNDYISNFLQNDLRNIDIQTIEIYGVRDEQISFINVFQDNKVYHCLFPEYYVNKCIHGH
jgi:hypothetical protein